MNYYRRAIIMLNLQLEECESNCSAEAILDIIRALRAYAQIADCEDEHCEATRRAELHEAALLG